MEEEVLFALKSRAAYLPGGHDRDGRALIVVNISSDLQPWHQKHIATCLSYIKKSLSTRILDKGLTVILDLQKCSKRISKSQLKSVVSPTVNFIKKSIIIRPEGFWDKHVEPYTKSQSIAADNFTILAKSRLCKYFELNQLPEELGGTIAYNHEIWLQNHMLIEDFDLKYHQATNELENLYLFLLNHKSVRPLEADRVLQSCTKINSNVQMTIETTIQLGKRVITSIDNSYRTKNGTYDCCKMPQDLHAEQSRINSNLNDLEKKQTDIQNAYNELEKSIKDAWEIFNLEEGISSVTTWILNTGELLLNNQLKFGCDTQTCEELRRENENLEMKCRETYGIYAELTYKIEKSTCDKNSFAFRDLVSQKDFMDFVCRGFAARLDRRRNILITSSRFFRLVSEYFDKTNEVFDTLVMGTKIEDFTLASITLQKLIDSQQILEKFEKELTKEGEKLSDMLSMAVKDTLGRDIDIDYSDDIANIRDILGATTARRNIFIDSLELQKMTLEQVSHIDTYEKDASVAVKWIEDLFNVMIKCHSHVGCSIHEIQQQKNDLQSLQKTAKSICSYGCQLISAAVALRHTCRLDIYSKIAITNQLQQIWNNLHAVSQEQLTRLRVSAVFHRSVEEYCNKLQELKQSVLALSEIDEFDCSQLNLRKCLTTREHLLVEVGRMVRLGRLLKTRLREPFLLSDTSNNNMQSKTETIIYPTGENSVACEAISRKLTDISNLVECLDGILKSKQSEINRLHSSNSSFLKKSIDSIINASAEEGSSSIRSTEDESFVTASECNCAHPSTSSSSFQSFCSPWNSSFNSTFPSEDIAENDDSNRSQILSESYLSANGSFDSSDRSFKSAQQTSSSSSSSLTLKNELEISSNNIRYLDDAIKRDANLFTIQKSIPSSISSWDHNLVRKQIVKGCM